MSRDSQADPSKQFITKEKRKELLEKRGLQADIEDVEMFALADLRCRLRVAMTWGFSKYDAYEAIRRAAKTFQDEVQGQLKEPEQKDSTPLVDGAGY